MSFFYLKLSQKMNLTNDLCSVDKREAPGLIKKTYVQPLLVKLGMQDIQGGSTSQIAENTGGTSGGWIANGS